MSDHTLTLITTWAEVAILVFMVADRYGLLPWTTRMSGSAPRVGIVNAIWGNRTLIVAILGLAFIAWLNFGRSATAPGEFPVSEDDARLDVARMEPVVLDADHQIRMNIHVTNGGKELATDAKFSGLLATSPTEIDNSIISPFLIMLKAQIALTPHSPIEIRPGQTNLFFTVPNMLAEDPKLYEAWNTNSQLVYGFAVIRANSTVNFGKHVYTEVCFYWLTKVVHLCGSGIRSYVSD